jgi:hypothetical protein
MYIEWSVKHLQISDLFGNGSRRGKSSILEETRTKRLPLFQTLPMPHALYVIGTYLVF